MTTPQPHPLNPNAQVYSSNPSIRYASFQHRLGGYALDCTLAVLTLGIGWMIWSFVVWGEGLTPAKKILKMRTVNSATGRNASWGHMAVRELLVPLTVYISAIITGGLTAIVWITIEIVFYFTKDNRTLRDLWVKTAIVNEA
ncbi:RDD [Candidatus Nanopelagicaceae bacterium]